MKRNQKVAALTKALQASDSQKATKHLQNVRDGMPITRIIVDDFGMTDEVVINDESQVSFRYSGTDHRMPLELVRGFIKQHGITDRWLVVWPEL